MELDQFFTDSKNFIESFDNFCTKHYLKDIVKADHICYKCASQEEFEKMRKMFEDNSNFIYQSIISKRRIAYIGFKNGIETSIGIINYLELSDQKPDGSQKSEFDHIEIYPTSISYIQLVQKFEDGGVMIIKKERPHHTTHDMDIGNGFLIRLTHEPLIEKIKVKEMV